MTNYPDPLLFFNRLQSRWLKFIKRRSCYFTSASSSNSPPEITLMAQQAKYKSKQSGIHVQSPNLIMLQWLTILWMFHNSVPLRNKTNISFFFLWILRPITLLYFNVGHWDFTWRDKYFWGVFGLKHLHIDELTQVSYILISLTLRTWR